MRRREFITLLGGAAVIWSSAGIAQQPKVPTIGVLVVGSPGSGRFWQLFRELMRELGYVEGRSIRYEFRSDEGQVTRLPELAATLVRLNVDLIVTWFTPAAQAAKGATREIPIVMAFTGNPIETGLVESLNRPGGNITGVSFVSGLLGPKRLDMLRQLIPAAATMAMLVGTDTLEARIERRDVELAAQALGQQLIIAPVGSENEFDGAFMSIVGRGAKALLVGTGPLLTSNRERVAGLAARHAIPAIYALRECVEAGGLMSYGASFVEAYRQAAIYAGRVLKGEKPADLPVMQSAKFELVINLKAAKALGLSIPPTLLATADEVIE
jgi:ABC-type uncharacterized transport system substrate-binding protein